MKKVFFAIVAVAVMFTACSKESKLNRKLDGEWTLKTQGGVAVPSGSAATVKFDKDKKGEGTVTYTMGSLSVAGTYELDGDDKMYLTFSTDKDTMYIAEYSKTKLVFTDAQGTAASKEEWEKK